jgi:hypothetical protein
VGGVLGDAGHRTAEHQRELGGMSERPAAKRPDHVGEPFDRVGAGAGGDPFDLPLQLREEVADDLQDQGVEAVEVAVDARGGHPHVPGDGAQRDARRPAGDQLPPGGALDLGDGRRPQPLAPAGRGGCHRDPS